MLWRSISCAIRPDCCASLTNALRNAAPARFARARLAAEPLPRHAYLPFGAGPRICIGASFALTEAIVVLARLLQRFRLELAPGSEHVLPRGVVTTQPDRPVRFILRAR